MRAAQKTRATKGDLVVAAAIVILALLLGVCLLGRPSHTPTVQVVQDGTVLLTCRLDELEEPMQFSVEGVYPLTLELSQSGVRVLETTCPGEDCKHMGTISTTQRQIVCLPNRLVVSLKDTHSDYDAITG